MKINVKKEVIKYLRQDLRDSMFGDGLEDDYIMDGVNFKGLNNMTDEELIEELRQSFDEDAPDLCPGAADLLKKATQ